MANKDSNSEIFAWNWEVFSSPDCISLKYKSSLIRITFQVFASKYEIYIQLWLNIYRSNNVKIFSLLSYTNVSSVTSEVDSKSFCFFRDVGLLY